MAALDEDKITRYIKVIVVIAPCFLLGLDYSLWFNIREGIVFKISRFGMAQVKSTSFKFEPTILTLIPILILTMTILQLRIEYENHKRGEKTLLKFFKNNRNDIGETGDQDDPVGKHFGYKICSIRILLLIGIAFFAMYVSMNLANLDLLLLIMYVINNFAVPIMVVWSHPGMRHLAKRKIKQQFAFCILLQSFRSLNLPLFFHAFVIFL